MTGKRVILFILLALGILLVGGGVWLLLGPGRPEITPKIIELNIAKGEPIIFQQLINYAEGKVSYLNTFSDGSVTYIEAGNSWKTGKLSPEELEGLTSYLENVGLDKLDSLYQFSPSGAKGLSPIFGGTGLPPTVVSPDMIYILSVKYKSLNKTIIASGYERYFKNQKGYLDMPSPLKDIYIKLNEIAMKAK